MIYQKILINVYQLVTINKWESSIVLQPSHIKKIQINSLTLAVNYKLLQFN